MHCRLAFFCSINPGSTTAGPHPLLFAAGDQALQAGHADCPDPPIGGSRILGHGNRDRDRLVLLTGTAGPHPLFFAAGDQALQVSPHSGLIAVGDQAL